MRENVDLGPSGQVKHRACGEEIETGLGQLDPAFAEKFLTFIIAEVIRHHESIADDAANGTS